mmetsp:Transcript_8659/g.9925  ORF Transcript_8659/g.9925 Transcript_8659/m.9925 type:complete len:684 (-) Transcript_8659:111-2162(-)
MSDKPGAGWTNGDKPPSMFPLTRDGKLSLYSSERRWIGLNKGWTRIGKGSTEMDARHSSSQTAGSIEETPEEEAESVKALISQLCEQFYRNGWATGTGGGVSIRVGGPLENRPYRVFVAPSGIQKEDMIGDDIFELDMDRNLVKAPKTPNLRLSACTPLWYVVYKYRPNARCVIHTHSINAQLATLLDPTESCKALNITYLEMLKGVGNHAYDDLLEVPIIDNRASEDLLADQLEQAINDYPKCNAVLVRRHGLYAWGDSWEQAKTQCESFDYLFETAIRMRQIGLDPGAIPKNGSYRVNDDIVEEKLAKIDTDAPSESSNNYAEDAESSKSTNKMYASQNSPSNNTDGNDATLSFKNGSEKVDDVKSKPGNGISKGKIKVDPHQDSDEVEIRLVSTMEENLDSAETGEDTAADDDCFRGKSKAFNQADVDSNCIPMLPRNSNILLLDIEGCTTSIAFVKEQLFPYVTTKIASYLEKLQDDELTIIQSLLSEDRKKLPDDHSCKSVPFNQGKDARREIVDLVKAMVTSDVKATGLKSLQGKMWKAGYDEGTIKGHVYPDFIPMLNWCESQNIQIYIYSSGSVEAQKLLFSNSINGNLIKFFKGHFDTKIGGKKEAASYAKIAESIGVNPSEITFVSDAEAELVAAKEASIGNVIMSIRPGNAPLTPIADQFPSVHSLLQLCGT